jgi:hypothetical protein
MSPPPFVSTPPICRTCVTKVESHADAALCVFADQTRLVLSRRLGSRVAMGDEITFRSTLYQILHIRG